MPLRIYISHAWEDQACVNQLRDTLKANHFHVFLCEDLHAGSDWQKEIDTELGQTDVFVYCFSSASVARNGRYKDELKAARARYRVEGEQGILIVPLQLEPCGIPVEVQDLMVLYLPQAGGVEMLIELFHKRSNRPSRHVFLLHGIKTRGKWQKDIAPLLSERKFIPVLLDFGYFLALQLAWPPSRSKKIKWLLDEYQRECARLGCETPSIIAHSFGSYLVARLLQKYPQVRFDRVIFCGSIVHPDFPWDEIAGRGQVRAVLNQYGGQDLWAGIVQWGVQDAGPAGRSGFRRACDVLFQELHAEFEHSDYFFDLNYTRSWIPFLSGERPAGATGSAASLPVNWRLWLVRAMAVLVIGVGIWSWAKPVVEKQPFRGFVQDERGNPVAGVKVLAPLLNLPAQETDANGRFAFEVALPAGTNFRVILQKTGFEPHTADPPAGDTSFNVTLHKLTGRETP